MKKNNHIQGMTILACMTDLDDALILEAEVDAAYLPIRGSAARRRRNDRDRKPNAFVRFMNSGWGAAVASVVVACGVLFAIIYAVNNVSPKEPDPHPGIQGTYPTEPDFAITTSADRDRDRIDAFFDVDEGEITGKSLLKQYKNLRKTLYHVTPAGVYEATGARIFKDSESCESYLLLDERIYLLAPGFGGYGFHYAVPCDYDGNGVEDILYTASWGSGVHRSVVYVFNVETHTVHYVYDTLFFSDGNPQINLVILQEGSGEDAIFTAYTVNVTGHDDQFTSLTFTKFRHYAPVLLKTGELPLVDRWAEPDPDEVFLPGRVPFAPESAAFSMTTDTSISAGEDRITVHMTSATEHAAASEYDGFILEQLTGSTWTGDIHVVTRSETVSESHNDDHKLITLTAPLTPGIYRLHAVKETDNARYSVRFCEFAVDNGSGYYKTWTEADFADAVYAEETYTISLQARLPYGASEIAVSFRAIEPNQSFTAPTACRLVRLDDPYPDISLSDAGAAFAVANDDLSVAVQPDIEPGMYAVASHTEIYRIINPAALLPGKYRIYNVDSHGTVYATCDLEILGTPAAWPGSPDEEPTTDTAEPSLTQASESTPSP